MPPEARLRIAVTGAAGFIGRNLMLRLRERGLEASPVTRDTSPDEAKAIIAGADAIVHLAGANRPGDPGEFWRSNRDCTAALIGAAAQGGKCPLVVFASSTKALDDSDYGRSKQAAEALLAEAAQAGVLTAAIYRLPNVFGKWARPGYNSAVATFCHNIARGLPIAIDDPTAPLALLHVDDLIDQWLALLDGPTPDSGIVEPDHVFRSSVGALAETIRAFESDRREGRVAQVGEGLLRRLYATYVSMLPREAFSYPLTAHGDPRGHFVEMLKTPASGQIACFTAYPGVTRGGHYHHAKVEKFLVVHGAARFRFRHMLDGAAHELCTSAETPVVVESIPGWTHDVTNIGQDMLAVLVWASECFDPARPDTVSEPV